MTINRFNRFLRSPEDDGLGGGGGAPPVVPPVVEPPAGGASPLINDDYSFAPDWADRLGDDAKGMTFKSLPDVLKSNRQATAKITELSQKLKDAGETTVIPADSSGYIAEIKIPETLPEGVTVPEGMLAAAAQYGIDNKIPPSVTQKFLEFQIGQAGKEAEAIKTQEFALLNNAKAEIEKRVGKENYDVTVSNATAAHDLLGLTLSKDDLLRNPSLVTSLAEIHKKISPAALKELNLSSEGQSAVGKLQQAEAIVGDEANPDYTAFHDTSHINHQTVMDKYNRLIAESASRG